MVSSPSQIEKQTVIWRTDATNDYLKICFKDDFDGMPSKIMRETIARMFLLAPLSSHLRITSREAADTDWDTATSYVHYFSTTIRIGSKTLPMKRGKTRVPLGIWWCLCTVAHWSDANTSQQMCHDSLLGHCGWLRLEGVPQENNSAYSKMDSQFHGNTPITCLQWITCSQVYIMGHSCTCHFFNQWSTYKRVQIS